MNKASGGDGIPVELFQIPYDYKVEVRNRFKGLDLIDRVPDEQCLISSFSSCFRCRVRLFI